MRHYEKSGGWKMENRTWNMTEGKDLEQYITVQELCSLLRISQTTAYRMIKGQQIPAVKVGRRYKIPRSMFDSLNPRYL